MENTMGGQKSLTPEDLEKIKTRTISDADLYKGGAESMEIPSKNSGESNVVLQATEEQKRMGELEMMGEKVDTLKDYIRISKKIEVPAEDKIRIASGREKGNMNYIASLASGSYLFYQRDPDNLGVYFIDKDGNIASVLLEREDMSKKVKEFEGWSSEKIRDVLESRLNSLGFSQAPRSISGYLADVIIFFREEVLAKEREKEQTGFDL